MNILPKRIATITLGIVMIALFATMAMVSIVPSTAHFGSTKNVVHFTTSSNGAVNAIE